VNQTAEAPTTREIAVKCTAGARLTMFIATAFYARDGVLLPVVKIA